VGAGKRKQECAEYRACLNHAMAQGWSGFNCCERFVPVPQRQHLDRALEEYRGASNIAGFIEP
jgi:hypothetical protein